MKLPILTVAKIRKWKPCYDPVEEGYGNEKWRGTILDIMRMDVIPVEDRIWCATQCMDDKQNRLLAVWCAREALKLVDKPDPRSIEACNVAERFANGEASLEELNAAWAAARAAWAAARAAAWAARDAAWAARDAAARDAVWATGAAEATVEVAARDAAAAERQKQVDKIIEMLEAAQ